MDELSLKPIRISSSQKRKFLQCPRAWELKYNYGLTKKSISDKYYMLLGSAVHYGLAYALTKLYHDGEFFITEAENSVHTWYGNELAPHKMAWVDGVLEEDTEYYSMMLDVLEESKKLLRFYLKRLDLGTKYDVAGEHQIIEGGDRNKPVVEWGFELPLPSLDTDEKKYPEVKFSGYIDAILIDKVTGELVIVDWKIVGQLTFDKVAMLDDQLFIYAALLSKIGVNVGRLCLYQLRSKLPAYPSISEVSGLPNTGGTRGFDTTEDFWKEHLPANIKAEQWLPKLKGKFKTLAEWIRPVYMVVNSDANNLTLLNLIATARMMLDAIQRDSFPAILDKHVCKTCEFLDICSGLQYGGDPSMIIQQKYDKSDKPDERIE